MRRIALLLSCCLFPLAAWARTPPPLPANLPALRTPPVPHLQPAPPVGPPVRVWTPELIKSLHLSSTVERDFLMHLLPNLVPSSNSNVSSSNSDVPSPSAADAVERTRELRRLRVTPNTTAGSTARATSDTNQDIEPAIITNRFVENGVTVDRTTTAFTKFDANNVPHHYWTSTTDYVNFTGWPTGTQLLPPPPTDRSSDPMLSENPYNCNPCAFQKRTYAVGTSYNINAMGQQGHSALTVWYTDDPGGGPNSWTTMIVDEADNPIFFDKPSIWTSWDLNHGTLGYTYVAVVVLHFDTSLRDLQVYQQTATFGFTLVNRQFLNMNSFVTSPIITVDAATGDVYLLWLDALNSVIEIARSTNQARTFGTPVAVAAQSLLRGCTTLICDSNNQNCVQAPSTIMARPNAADNSIGVVWHLRETDGLHTDVGFNRFQLGTIQAWTWFRGIQLGHVGANDGRDQWNPALDPAPNGSYMTVWYDKRQDMANNLYQVYAEKVNADGTAIDATDTLVYNSNLAARAKPSLLPPIRDTGCNVDKRYIGDYQDIWEWFGTWHGSTIYQLPNTNQQDVYITSITP